VTVAAPSRFFFEDVVLHGVIETPAITVTRAHVALYAGVTGDGAADAPVAPELLLVCLTTGLGWRVPQPPLAVLAFMGLEWHVDAPLRVGDTIHSRSRTAVKRAMREGGVIVEEREVINQRGEVVQRGRFSFLVAKRPSGEPVPGSPPPQEASA
jgi:acyl dehydratase